MPFATGVLSGRDDLAAAAQLLHALCFDRVELQTPKLSYEPRWSCQCRDCAAVWVASKSGDVMRIDLETLSGRPGQTWFPGNREARTIYHQHDGTALDGKSCLFIGRDNGALDIISDQHEDWTGQQPPQRHHGSPNSFHLDSWWARPDERSIAAGFPRTAHAGNEYTMGITAIAALARPGSPDTLDILVATRRPSLYVIEARRGTIRIRHRIPMPGWIQWIIAPPDDDRVTCISRSGDLVRFYHEELLTGSDGQRTAMSQLPTAALPFGDGSVLLGTTTGLVLVRDGHSEVVIPVTRSPVLCLDRTEVTTDGHKHCYITMGLEDGRLRVVDADLLRWMVNGGPKPKIHNHNFAIEMGDAARAGDAVLAIETLQIDSGPPNSAYVLAVLRDHSVCLFQVKSDRTQRACVTRRWDDFVRRAIGGLDIAGAPADPLAAELDVALAQPPPDFDSDAWNYMLVDVVLPRLCTMAPTGGDMHRRLVELACETARGADRFVLKRLSDTLGQLTGGDIGLLLELSRSILGAVPLRHDRRWAAFIDGHLRELNALARRAHDHDLARLVAWTRFVRKYVLLGHTFAAKQLGLRELVEQNHETHKYFDALIYQARLSQCGYDLRWESCIAEDVSGLHTIVCDERTIVAVVTVSGKLAFLDGGNGRRLEIRSGPRLSGVRQIRDRVVELAPFGERGDGPCRTLACAIARAAPREDILFRLALSCSGAPAPGLAIIEVGALDASAVIVEGIFTPACPDDHARVHALQPLPGCADAFVAGLDTSHAPVGLVRRVAAKPSGRSSANAARPENWILELTNDDGHMDAPDPEGPSKLIERPDRIPTRALAVAAVDDAESRYLVVAGSDDGLVRAFSFAAGEPARTWQVSAWDRVTDAISSAVVCRRRQTRSTFDRPDPDDGLFICYLGTAAGDTFALSLARARSDAGAAATSFAGYHAQPLWRDTHDGPVLAMRVWRTTLFEPNEVLVVVTEKGRLCIYNHSNPVPDRLSAAYNYYFRGMRLDRVTMSDRFRALTMVDGGREFIAAAPGGQLYMGQLVYLRNSVDRDDRDDREPPDRSRSRGEPPGSAELPPEMWDRLDHLFAASRHDEPFEVADDRRSEIKLDLCELIRLEGGALSAHALHLRLSVHERWDELDPDRLRDKVLQLLRELDPENPEDAERIKIIIKSLCRAFLLHDPRALKEEMLETPEVAPSRHAKTAAACEAVAEYLTRDLAYPTSAAARLRTVSIKELLRAPVLRHMSWGKHQGRVRAAVESALDSCLRDDDRLVRIEALRAMWVALRNVGIMAGRERPDRDRFIAALFPQGLGSLSWLLELIVGGLQRFPSFTRRTVLVSGAWYLVSALLPLFYIFPDRTLALCDYLVRAGLSVEVLAMLFRSLRGQETAASRSRIKYLYLVPARHARDEYIEYYNKHKPGHRKLQEEMNLLDSGPCALPDPHAADRPASAPEWYQLDDAALAERRTQLFDRLARMWDVEDHDQLKRDVTTFRVTAPREAAPAPQDAPLAVLEGVVHDLASVAEALASGEAGAFDRLVELGEQHRENISGKSTLTAPLRTVVSSIVAAWREVYKPPLREGSTLSRIYKLGRPITVSSAMSLFELTEPPDLKTRYVIKVLQLDTPDAAVRFLRGALLNQELCKQAPDCVAEVIDVLERPCRAYIMRRYPEVLEDLLRKDFHRNPSIEWTVWVVAVQIGQALRAAHACDRYHGNVKPANIFVADEHDVPVFRLGDFDLVSAPTAVVPSCLSEKHLEPLARRKWEDIAALALVLYRMLTGETIDPRETVSLRRYSKCLRALRQGVRHHHALRVIDTVIRIFEDHEPPFDIQAFLDSLKSPPDPDPMPVQQMVTILFLAANPSDQTRLELPGEVEEIRQRLRGTGRGSVFRLEQRWEVRAEQMQGQILEAQPTIVHFSGHGTDIGELVFHGADGTSAPLAIETIANVFRILRKYVRCAVLSACYSQAQAVAIAAHIDVVIGMSAAIPDDAARAFAGELYEALASGEDVKTAFDLACSAIAIALRRRGGPLPPRDIESPEPPPVAHPAQIPQLHVRNGIDASELRFVTRPPR